MSDPYVREVGRVVLDHDAPVRLGVDYDTVMVRIGDRACNLTQAQAEEFAQLFVSAVWQAGQQKARMDADVVDAEIWCGGGNCVKGPGLHQATETCRVREPEVAPGADQP